MAPTPAASGATRGSSETDELLVNASASRGADVRDVDGRRSSAARTAVRVAAVGACALAGVAAVSGDVFGHLAGVAAFGGSDDRARLGESREGRWATAFDLADDSAFSLRDGKRGAWGAARGVARGVAGPASETNSEGTDTRRAGSRSRGSIPSLRSAPALPEKKPSRFQKWDRAPYEYEMPAVFSSLGDGDGDGDASSPLVDPRDRVRLGAAREQSLRGDAAASRPKVARAAERVRAHLRHRRFAAADLGDAPVDPAEASERSEQTPHEKASEDSEEAYAYEESYDNDGSVPWDAAVAPPPPPPAPGTPPAPLAPREPTSEEAAAIGKASAGTSTYYPVHDRVVRVAPWGAKSTPASANDGALKPRAPDAAAAKAAEAARAARRAKEERWKRLEADGGKPTTTADDRGRDDEASSSSSSSAVEGRTKSPKKASAKSASASAATAKKRRERPASEIARGEDYDDAWLGEVQARKTMNRAEKNAAVLSEREFREAFVGADYDDASALLNARQARGKMTEEEIADARAGGLMASLGAGAASADVESYEADLAAGRAFASSEEEAAAKAEAKARDEAEAARDLALEIARNEDGSIRWDAPPEVREALEAAAKEKSATKKDDGVGAEPEALSPSRKTFRDGERPTRARAVNPDGSVPWDAPEVPTYVFNEELRSRLGGEEGADASLAWDEKPESELVSSFVSAAGSLDADGDADDPQDSDEGAVAWTVAFDADAAAGDGALDEARRAEEAYDPSQSDHYLDDLLRPSDDALEAASVFGDQVAAVGEPRRSKRSEAVAGDEDSDTPVAWNDAEAWRAAVTGEASAAADPEEPEEDEAAAEEDDSAFGDDLVAPREIEFDLRDYDVGALGMRTRADPRLEPQSYEDELETGQADHHAKSAKGRPFRAAALGDAAGERNDAGGDAKKHEPTLLFRGPEPSALDAESDGFAANPVCEQTSARVGGPHRDESLCQKYAGDARMCQTYVAPTQSCWHKTVGGAFLDPASASPALGARGGRGPLTGKEDPAANAKWREAFYACMAGDPEFTGAVEAPYRLPLAPSREPNGLGAEPTTTAPAPPLAPKFFRATHPGTAYFYHFVHVPKAGGTYFKSLLHASETRRQRRLGGPDPRWDPALVDTWNTKPLVDMTEWSFANVVWRYVEGGKRGAAIAKMAEKAKKMNGNATQTPVDDDDDALAILGRAERDADRVLGASNVTPQFTGPGMRASYQQGHRAVSKGSLSMGACDVVDAPCAYLTVLRDPWEKFMSFYQYACLEGSENMGAWTDQWREDARAKGYDVNGCPASPTQFYKDVGGMMEVLAPGAAPDSHCAVEAAKRNLASPCMRFLLLEQLEEGLGFMRDTLPDFADIGTERAAPAADAAAQAQAKMVNSRRNGSGARMDDAKQRRLDAYRADEREMRELRRLMAGELEVYRFAKEERYRAQWEEPLQTC